MNEFNYNEAFKRNIGLVSVDEQEKIKQFTIAILGMGGVGGSHFISLVRQGFTKFKIADLDKFELKNFNRQFGAHCDTIGKPKAEVMKKIALSINPECNIEVYDSGINKENIEEFLKNIDLSVDGLDFFELEVRRLFFNKSHEKKIPLITAGPIGLGSAYLIFLPSGPNFDKYFNIKDNMSYEEKLIHFALGIAPSMLQRDYMRNASIKEKAGPSSIASINICSGVVVINALKILLNRREVKAVPYYHQFDAYKNKYVCRKVFMGNKNPLQKLKAKIALKMMEKKL